jgi:hypothetical protein
LLLPDADAHVIEDILQQVDAICVEAAAEVAGGGRIALPQSNLEERSVRVSIA